MLSVPQARRDIPILPDEMDQGSFSPERPKRHDRPADRQAPAEHRREDLITRVAPVKFVPGSIARLGSECSTRFSRAILG